ncbi:MAG: hypothetical protein HQL39_01410 [Alphaproteobacteria bacterium]|nr:hypothetical protein [Alphaproteobacteria bacterium]
MSLRYSDVDEVAKPRSLGYQGYPAFKLGHREHRTGVLEAFMGRLPPRSRTDFGAYLEGLRLSECARLSDFALLGYSEAKLPSDGFSLVHTFEEGTPPFELMMEVAGHRHHRTTKIDIGDELLLEPEPDNQVYPRAVRVVHDGRRVGYVNRLQTPVFHRWIKVGAVKAVVEKMNGKADHPRLFAFVWIGHSM